MLSVMYGVLAMMPMTFGVAGYVLVSRHCAVPNPTSRLTVSQRIGRRSKDVDTLTNRKDQS